MLKKLLAALVLIGVIVPWDQYLFPPVARYASQSNAGIAAIVGELLKPVNSIYRDGIFVGWLFLVTTVLISLGAIVIAVKALRWAVDYITESETPISVLRMSAKVYMADSKFSRAVVSREQLLHANRSRTSAFFTVYTTDAANGRIDRDSLTGESFIGDKRVTKLPHLIRGSDKHVEFTERFNRDLPVSIGATYLPNRAVLWLHSLGCFKRTIVRRTASSEYLNEYSEAEPVFQLQASRYPVTEVSVALDFPLPAAPSQENISAFVMRQNAVEEIDLHRECDADRCIYTARVRHLKNANLRIEWKNR